MQLWDNPVPSGAVGKDCQRRLLNRPRFVKACSATDFYYYLKENIALHHYKDQLVNVV
jgi:hypothetical protein